jgi:hypothetical protein
MSDALPFNPYASARISFGLTELQDLRSRLGRVLVAVAIELFLASAEQGEPGMLRMSDHEIAVLLSCSDGQWRSGFRGDLIGQNVIEPVASVDGYPAGYELSKRIFPTNRKSVMPGAPENQDPPGEEEHRANCLEFHEAAAMETAL